MVEEQLLNYLKEKTKGKLLMSPEQLAEEIGIPTKQQSKLRKEGRFPIPFKNIGRLVYYSIYDVANFLLNGETTPSEEVQEVAPVATVTKPKVRKSPSSPVQDLSHIFMVRAFAQSLEDRATAMLQLSDSLKKYANSYELKERFENKFSSKGSQSTNDGKI
jgi:hypothetical protein